MGMKNGVWVSEIVKVTTKDLDLIERFANNEIYPYSIWVDIDTLEYYPKIVNFLKDGYQKELEMLQKSEIDYIVIEYDA